MQPYPFSLSAAGGAATDTTSFDVPGTFIRYDKETSGAASPEITFKTDNGQTTTLKPGDGVDLNHQFGRLYLSNFAGVNNLAGQFSVGGVGERIFPGNLVGNVTLTGSPIGTAKTDTKKTATAASTQALAANPNRKYLAAQLISTAPNSVFLRDDGGVAAADATSFELLPGETWEPPIAPVGQINMIRGNVVAANQDFLIIEG